MAFLRRGIVCAFRPAVAQAGPVSFVHGVVVGVVIRGIGFTLAVQRVFYVVRVFIRCGRPVAIRPLVGAVDIGRQTVLVFIESRHIYRAAAHRPAPVFMDGGVAGGGVAVHGVDRPGGGIVDIGVGFSNHLYCAVGRRSVSCAGADFHVFIQAHTGKDRGAVLGVGKVLHINVLVLPVEVIVQPSAGVGKAVRFVPRPLADALPGVSTRQGDGNHQHRCDDGRYLLFAFGLHTCSPLL